MSEDGIIDWNEALDQVGGSEDLLVDVAQTFLDLYPEMLDQIRSAAAAGDAAELRRAAHTLKGSVDVFAAREAHDAALALELIGKDERFDEAPPAIEKVEAATERLVSALKARL